MGLARGPHPLQPAARVALPSAATSCRCSRVRAVPAVALGVLTWPRRRLRLAPLAAHSARVGRRAHAEGETNPGGTAAATIESQDSNETLVLVRVILPTVLAFLGGTLVYVPVCEILQNLLDIGNTGSGPILSLLGMDQSQFMQNFLTVNGLLFTILCGNTHAALYNQQEQLYHALFREVSEAKSLLEQASFVCQGRPFYPKVLASISDYVGHDLRRLDAEPADLLANRPSDDPLEYILYVTSVGVPSLIYDTVRDLRQARGQRLGAMQRKLPGVHFLLLYALGFLELLAFPLLGAGTASMAREHNILDVQAVFFGSMCGAIVMTLQVIYELWRPFGGAYTVDVVLGKMVSGLEEELRARRDSWALGTDFVPREAMIAEVATSGWGEAGEWVPHDAGNAPPGLGQELARGPSS